MTGSVAIMAMNLKKNGHQKRNEDDDYPGAIYELGYREYDCNNGSAKSTKPIDHHFMHPTLVIA